MDKQQVIVRVHKIRREGYGFLQVVLKAEHGEETYHQATINHQAGHKYELYIATNGTSEMLSAATMREAYRLGHRAIRLMHRMCCLPVDHIERPFWHPSQMTITNVCKQLGGYKYVS